MSCRNGMSNLEAPNSPDFVEFLYSPSKIIHNFGPKTEMVSVP